LSRECHGGANDAGLADPIIVGRFSAHFFPCTFPLRFDKNS
jgi:hypothetical protein